MRASGTPVSATTSASGTDSTFARNASYPFVRSSTKRRSTQSRSTSSRIIPIASSESVPGRGWIQRSAARAVSDWNGSITTRGWMSFVRAHEWTPVARGLRPQAT